MLGSTKNTSQWIILLIFLSLWMSCVYNVEEELYPSQSCTLENISYTQTISAILENNCLVCHNAATNQGGITLEGYTALKRQVDSGRLLGAIQRQPGFSPMPKDAPQLLDCQIAKIEQWISDGAPNN